MTQNRARVRRQTSISLLFALLLGLLLLNTTADAAAPPPALTIQNISPGIVTDQEKVSVRVHVANLDTSATSNIKLGAFVRADPFQTFEGVEQFLENGADDGWSAGEHVLTKNQLKQAGTAKGVNINLRIKLEDTPLWNPDAWGSYGVTVQLNGPQPVKDQSIFLWYPPDSTGKVHVNGLTNTGSATLGTTVALPAPEIEQNITETTNWSKHNEILVLPAANSSPGLLAATDQTELYETAIASRELSEPTKDVAREKQIDLVEDTLIAESSWWNANLLGNTPGQKLILQGPPPAQLFAASLATTSKFSMVSHNPGVGYVNKTVLTDCQEITNTMNTATKTGAEEFQVKQKLRAATALAATSDHNGENYVHFSALNAPEDKLENRLDTVFDVPWVQPATLQETLAATPSATFATNAPSALTPELKDTQKILQPLAEGYDHAHQISRSTDEPEQLLKQVDAIVLPATQSNISTKERKKLVKQALKDLETAINVVEIAPTSTINMMNYKADLPLLLTNVSETGINVEVTLIPADDRLQPGSPVTTRIPAEGTVDVALPMTAVGTGNIDVTAIVTTSDGVELDRRTDIHVRLRAGVEDTLTVVIGAVLVGLFGLGLVRSLRKNRRKRPTGEIPDPASEAEKK